MKKKETYIEKKLYSIVTLGFIKLTFLDGTSTSFQVNTLLRQLSIVNLMHRTRSFLYGKTGTLYLMDNSEENAYEFLESSRRNLPILKYFL